MDSCWSDGRDRVEENFLSVEATPADAPPKLEKLVSNAQLGYETMN